MLDINTKPNPSGSMQQRIDYGIEQATDQWLHTKPSPHAIWIEMEAEAKIGALSQLRDDWFRAEYVPDAMKPAGANAWEGSNPENGVDYHIRLEGRKWVADVFDATVRTGDEAHLDSSEYPTFWDAYYSAHNWRKA